MADSVSTAALRARVLGKARTGSVTVRDFDQGVVETLGAKVIGDTYFITELSEFDPPPGMPGIPVLFAHPEEVFQAYKQPAIEVRRDDISPALNRWHPGTLHYRTPGLGATKATATFSDGTTKTGYDRMEELQQTCPYDLLYTINIHARSRQFMSSANKILAYVMRIYQPYCAVYVKDSIGDLRSYSATTESIQPIDEAADVAERVIGFALSLRIEGELDINDPKTFGTVTRLPTIRSSKL